MKNEPAFPVKRSILTGNFIIDSDYYPGLTLRDWFATHAPDMPDWYYKSFCLMESNKAKQKDTYIMKGQIEAICQWNWKYADAMLSVRAQEAK